MEKNICGLISEEKFYNKREYNKEVNYSLNELPKIKKLIKK